MADARKALIVGAGIGGLTAALALRQAGIDAVIFEQAAQLQDVQAGGGLLVWNNGMRALREIGLHEQAEAASEVLDVTTFNSYKGDVLATWPIDRVARDLGVPTVGVVRGDLHRVLANALGEDTVEVGAHYESFTTDNGGVTVRFSDGREEIAVMDIADAKPVKQWGTGPATLLGDAAHPILPNLGQGTSQALEDAIVLARSLRQEPDVVTALRAYEKQRSPRTAGLVKFSRNLGRIGRFKSRPAVAFRERFMKVGLGRIGWKQAVALTSFGF